MPLGHILQAIGALTSENRPPGLSGIVTALTSPTTLLGQDLADEERKRLVVAINEPGIAAFRKKGMEQAHLGNYDGVTDMIENVTHELGRRGINPNMWLRTEGLIAQNVARMAQGQATMEKGQDARIDRLIGQLSGGDPQKALELTQQFRNAGLLTTPGVGTITEGAGGALASRNLGGQPWTQENVQGAGSTLMQAGVPFNRIPSPLVAPPPKSLEQQQAEAEARAQGLWNVTSRNFPQAAAQAGDVARKQAEGRIGEELRQGPGIAAQKGQEAYQTTVGTARGNVTPVALDAKFYGAKARASGDIAGKTTPEAILQQANLREAIAKSTVLGRSLGDLTPEAQRAAATNEAIRTGSHVAAEATALANPTVLEQTAAATRNKAAAQRSGEELGHIEVVGDPTNLATLEQEKRRLAGATTAGTLQAKTEQNMRAARTVVGQLKSAFEDVQGQLPTGDWPRWMQGTYNKVRAWAQSDPRLTKAVNLGQTSLSTLARSLGGEVGNLAEQEQLRIAPLIPAVDDTVPVVATKLALLDTLIRGRLGDDGRSIAQGPFRMEKLLPPALAQQPNVKASDLINYFTQTYQIDEATARTLVRGLRAAEDASLRAYSTSTLSGPQ
jgi:hypothetical protein